MLRRSAIPPPQSGPESQALLQSLESSFTIRSCHTVTEALSSIGYPYGRRPGMSCPMRVAVEVRALGAGHNGMSAELAFTCGWTFARSQ